MEIILNFNSSLLIHNKSQIPLIWYFEEALPHENKVFQYI